MQHVPRVATETIFAFDPIIISSAEGVRSWCYFLKQITSVEVPIIAPKGWVRTVTRISEDDKFQKLNRGLMARPGSGVDRDETIRRPWQGAKETVASASTANRKEYSSTLRTSEEVLSGSPQDQYDT